VRDVATYEEIYRRQLEGDEQWTWYGHSNHGGALIEHFATMLVANDMTLLDFGCGHNEFVLSLRENECRAIGYDPAGAGSDLAVLPVDRFDWVTSFDVLEHIPEEDVAPTLEALSQRADFFCFSIATRPSINTLDGKNLHPTVWSARKWIQTLRQHASLVYFDGSFYWGSFDPINDDDLRALLPSYASANIVFDDNRVLPNIAGTTLYMPTNIAEQSALASVSNWLRSMVAVPLDIQFDGDNVEEGLYESIREHAAAELSLNCSTEGDGGQVAENIARNLELARKTTMRQLWPAGADVVIVGGGPSRELAREVSKWVDKGGDRVVIVTDRAASMDADWMRDAFVYAATLELRPDKLDALASWRHPILAHIGAHPDRIPSDDPERVHFFRNEGEFPAPWIPALRGNVTNVTSFACHIAEMFAPRSITLIGAEHAILDGTRYTGNDKGDGERSLMVDAIGGGEVETIGEYHTGIYDLSAFARRVKARGIRIVNCTPRGALLPNWEHADLSEVLWPS